MAVVWPDWDALNAVNLMDGYTAANDEFGILNKALKAASAAEIDAQAINAQVTLTFLIGFADKKKMYRSHCVKAFQTLMAVPSWKAKFDALPDLQTRASLLHDDLRAALGVEQQGGGAAASSGKDDSTPQEAEIQPKMKRGTTEEDLDARLAAVASTNAVPEVPVGTLPHRAPDPVSTPSVQPAPAQPEQVDPHVKKMEPYLKRASALEGTEPTVAHYCRVYVCDQLMRLRQSGQATSDSNALLIATMGEAEKGGKPPANGRQSMETFAVNCYENANAADRASTNASSASTQLYLAALFIEVLAQFHDGKLPPSLSTAASYAKQRALHIRSCIAQGTSPEAPTPPALGLQPTAPTPAAPAPQPSAPAAPPPAAAPPPTAPAPVRAAAPTPVPASAPVPFASPARAADAGAGPVVDTQLGVGMSRAGKQREAKKRAERVSAAVDTDDLPKACLLIREALHLLEGM